MYAKRVSNSISAINFNVFLAYLIVCQGAMWVCVILIRENFEELIKVVNKTNGDFDFYVPVTDFRYRLFHKL